MLNRILYLLFFFIGRWFFLTPNKGQWSLTFFVLFMFPVWAYETQRTFRADEVPRELQGIKIDEKLRDFIDLNLNFTNEQGKEVRIGQYFQDRPVFFTIVYYLCPNLCQLHLNGLMEGMNQLGLEDDFEFVALSMDHNEKPSLAQAKKKNYIQQFKGMTGKNWHFLTGDEGNIQKISQQVGFRFRWNEKEKQFAHLPVAYVLTPKGKISRYLYGVEMSSKTLRLSLVEASQGRVGGVIDRILLFCFQFDPRKNRYTLYAYNVMKAGGVLIVILLLFLLVPPWLKSKKGQIS